LNVGVLNGEDERFQSVSTTKLAISLNGKHYCWDSVVLPKRLWRIIVWNWFYFI